MALTRVRAENILDSDFKNSCRATSFTNITLSGGAPSTLDGVTLAANDRILVQGQTTTNQNGIYYVSTLGSGSNGTWTRAQDAAQPYSITTGLLVYVNEGTNYGQRFYYVTTIGNIIVGTSSINFANLGSNFSNITATNITANTAIYSNAYYYGNGTPFTSSSYGNTQVAAYLPTYSGNISAGNITVTGNIYAANIITTYYETISQTEYANSIIASGNITAQTANVYASNIIANTGLYGYIATNAQTNITSVGTLGSLTVTGAVQANTHTGVAVYAGTIGNTGTTLTGTLSTPLQTNITSVGTLGSLTVTGAVQANTHTGVAVYAGTIGNTGATLTGTLSTASQTNITSVGTLGSLVVTGAVNANTFNSVAVYAGTIGNSGSTLTGTLSTATQTNITSVGTLTSLNSSGTVAAPTVIAATIGNAGAVLYGTLNSQSASQTNITSVGTLTGLTTSGNITAQTANVYAAYVIANTASYSGQYYWTNGATLASTIIGTYSNSNVNAYLPTYTGTLSPSSLTTNSGGQVSGYLTGAIGANTPNSGVFTTASTSGNLTVGGNLVILGNSYIGPVPTTFNYNAAPLNLTNSLAGALKTQLNLINTGGGAGAGSAIDFYTYTSVAGGSTPETRISTTDDGNYSGYIGLWTKAPGNTGANSLVERLRVDSAGNIVVFQTTTSTSTTTGALVVNGGVGIAGNLYIGGNLSIAGNTTFVNTTIINTTDTISAPAINAGTIGNTGATLTGTISTASQTNITSVGTLGSLTVSGTTNLQGTTNGATINATNLYATTIGNTAAAINGNLINGSAVYAGTIGNTGTTLTGTLSTAAQTNITSTGALTSPSFTTSSGGQLTGYHTGAIGANAANSGAFTTLTASGNTTLNNYANIYIATGSTSQTSALSIVGNVYGQGGTGYLDFLKLTNTYSAGTNPNKYFRLNSTGGLEVVNSAYTQTIFILSDTGSITIPTTATATVGNLVTTNGVYWPNGSVYSSGGGGGGSTSPGGANTMVQFNNGGSFAGATYLQYNITSGNLVSSSTTASTNNTTGAIVVSGGIGVGGNVTADIVHATNNGNGTNFQIGDDLWLGDINVSNTARVMGQQDNTQGYIVFGSTNATNYIGRSGSNPITVTGAFNVTGTTNLQGTTNGTTINATTIQGGTIGNSGATLTGTLSTAAQTNITSVGILTGLVSSANITAQTANVYAAYVVANSGLSGTLITNAQTNITSTGSLTSPSFTTSGGGQLTGYHTGAIGANTANTGSFTTVTTSGNLYGGGNIIAASGTTSTSTTTGALVVSGSGGVGIGGNVYTGGNIYTQQRTGYTYSGNSTSVAYTYYNAATGSLDTVFG